MKRKFQKNSLQNGKNVIYCNQKIPKEEIKLRGIGNMDYIDRIKLLKKEKKITNEVLSEKTGIPLGTLTKIMAGISESPKLSNIVSICEALDSTLDYIVAGIPQNTNNYFLAAEETGK